MTGLGGLFSSPASVKGCWGSFWYRSFSGFFQTYILSFFCSRAINFDQKLHLSCLWNLFPSNWMNYFITIWVCPSLTPCACQPPDCVSKRERTRTHTRLLLFLFTRRDCKINFRNIPRLASVYHTDHRPVHRVCTREAWMSSETYEWNQAKRGRKVKELLSYAFHFYGEDGDQSNVSNVRANSSYKSAQDT